MLQSMETFLLVKQPLIAAVLHRDTEQQVGWGETSLPGRMQVLQVTHVLYTPYRYQHSCYKA